MGFKNPWLGIRMLLYALNSSALDDVLGHRCPAEIAREVGLTKYDATKLLTEIQGALNLKPRHGQRDEESRNRMSSKRKSQLK
jgi:hypothetical protein